MSFWILIVLFVLACVVACMVHYSRSPASREAATNWGHGFLQVLDRVNRWYCRHFHGLGAERIPLPEKGGVVLVANHVSGVDPMLLIAASRRPIRFIIAKEQCERFYLRWFFKWLGCIPVDRKQRP